MEHNAVTPIQYSVAYLRFLKAAVNRPIVHWNTPYISLVIAALVPAKPANDE